MEDQFTDLQLESGEWVCNEADRMLKRYYSLKTEESRKKMEPLLRAMAGKLQSQKREICKLLGE